jgi:hypothetical protein
MVQEKLIASSQASDFFQKFTQARASQNAGSGERFLPIHYVGSGSHCARSDHAHFVTAFGVKVLFDYLYVWC